jgi:hypothetical protein
MKISNLIEQIFAQAVALDQQGGLRNTIYAIKNEIYIMSYDHTVLLRFRLRDSEISFSQPISFKANDYDSNIFEEVGGRIIFHTENEEYSRKKVCGTTDQTPEEIRSLFKQYLTKEADKVNLQLSKDVLELLDPALSHIEFSGVAGEPMKMVQRNIYSGGIIEIQPKAKGFFKASLEKDFGPIALKTNDFKALFAFQNILQFSFTTSEEEDYVLVKSIDKNKRDMKGLIACCVYDELINLKKEETTDGRKKQKSGRGV